MNELEKWLDGRPEIIKQMATKYPPGSHLTVDGKTAWVVSFDEAGSIGLSFINPFQNYDEAMNNIFKICGKCLKERCEHGSDYRIQG